MTDPRLMLTEPSLDLVDDIFFEHGADYCLGDIEMFDDGAEVVNEDGIVIACIYVNHEDAKVTVVVDDDEFYY